MAGAVCESAGAAAGSEADFIKLEEGKGSDTILLVDIDGKGSGSSFVGLAVLEGQVGLSLTDMITNNSLDIL